jgi:hypothetical protein
MTPGRPDIISTKMLEDTFERDWREISSNLTRNRKWKAILKGSGWEYFRGYGQKSGYFQRISKPNPKAIQTMSTPTLEESTTVASEHWVSKEQFSAVFPLKEDREDTALSRNNYQSRSGDELHTLWAARRDICVLLTKWSNRWAF